MIITTTATYDFDLTVVHFQSYFRLGYLPKVPLDYSGLSFIKPAVTVIQLRRQYLTEGPHTNHDSTFISRYVGKKILYTR